MYVFDDRNRLYLMSSSNENNNAYVAFGHLNFTETKEDNK